MNGEERRNKLINIINESQTPLSGSNLAKQLGVSRQVIVTDIALLRAANHQILSTSHGYVIPEKKGVKKVFKVRHTDEQAEEELEIFVDYGGHVEDIFVYHKLYGLVRAPMNVKSRLDIKNLMKDLKSGKSSLLSNLTSGYHYHTVSAESEEILKIIEDELWKHGFLAAIQDYEPEEFSRQLS